MKLVIVGEAPARRSGRRPFDGLSGDRLAKYMGLGDRDELLSRTECVNVLRRHPGPDGDKGSAFPPEQAQRGARRLLSLLRGRTVLLASKRVARAFGVRVDYLRWQDHPEGFRVAVIPHPSGVNRWWNEHENRRRFRRFARRTLRRTDLEP